MGVKTTGVNPRTAARLRRFVQAISRIQKSPAIADGAQTKGADVVAAPILLVADAGGTVFNVTGNTTITSIPEAPPAVEREVTYTGSPTITHNATSLILPGARNILAQPGDTARYRSLGSGNWKCMSHTRSDGSTILNGPYDGTSNTSIAIGSGSKAFTVNEISLAYVVGARMRASSIADQTNFVEGFIASIVGQVYTITSDFWNGSGTHTDWILTPGNFDFGLVTTNGAVCFPILFDYLHDFSQVNVASATTLALIDNITKITGNVTIEGIAASLFPGVERTLIFLGAPLLKYNAVTMILPTAADIQAAAGDVAIFRELTSGGSPVWECVCYTRASGSPLNKTIAESDVTSLVADLALKAPLASPTFTGVPAAPTAAAGTNTTQLATTAFIQAAITAADKDGINDLRMRYLTTSTFAVGRINGTSGTCKDSTNATYITLSATVTVTITTDATINGNDSFAGTGTASVTSGASAVTGQSSAFLTNFGTRTGAGTITNAGTTITGVNTAFLSECALGDLIGSAAAGYAQITAIASDTSLTIVSGITISGSAYKIIENPTIKISTNTTEQVSAIASDTALTIATTASATKTTQAYTIGNLLADGTMPVASQGFMYVWIGTGGSGTGCYVSTQRTTPFGITSYNVSVRRIGSVLIDASLIVPFSQVGLDRNRTYTYQNAKIGDSTRVLTNGTANATWTAVVCSGVVPPTALAATFVLTSLSITVGRLVSIRPRGIGSATTSRNTFLETATATSGSNLIVYDHPIDGAQCVDYTNDGTNGSAYIDVVGYKEIL